MNTCSNVFIGFLVFQAVIAYQKGLQKAWFCLNTL
jgi:hypothetical protein